MNKMELEKKILAYKLPAESMGQLEALCRELDCQPGDVLEYVKDE